MRQNGKPKTSFQNRTEIETAPEFMDTQQLKNLQMKEKTEHSGTGGGGGGGGKEGRKEGREGGERKEGKRKKMKRKSWCSVGTTRKR